MKRKNICISMCIIMAILMANAVEAKSKYQNIYGKVLNETKLDSLVDSLPIFTFYLVDIDRDGVKELVANTFRGCAIYTIKKNKAMLLRKWKGGVIVDQVYNRKEKSIALSFSYGTGLLNFEIIGIKRKKAVLIKSGQIQAKDYYINNELVPYLTFKNVYETCFSSSLRRPVCHSNTKGNQKKYLK